MIHGKGQYIWNIWNTEGGDIDRIVSLAKEAGLSHALVKIADGTSRFNVNAAGVDLALHLTNALQEGLGGWSYLLVMYCVLPAAGVFGLGAGLRSLRARPHNNLPAWLGLGANLLSLLPVCLMWALGLMSGLPFTCLQNMAFCR